MWRRRCGDGDNPLFIEKSFGSLLEFITFYRLLFGGVHTFLWYIIIGVDVTMHISRRRLPLRTRLYEYFTSDVREDMLLEAEMLALSFATGVGDATTYSEFRVFTANHTGNTILLAVGVTENASGRPPVNSIPIPLQLIVISLSMFILGGWIPGQIGNLVGSRRRWWLMANNFFQFMLVLSAAVIQAQGPLGWYVGPRLGGLEIDRMSSSVIAVLAFSAGGQVALSRALPMTEITTANATSSYIDLLIDENLFRIHNRRRNRRLVFLATLIAGSFCGGFSYQRYGSARTLLIASVGKGVVTIMLLFNSGGYFKIDRVNEKEDDSKSDLNF
jgi:uncharacterized membrane protein YoaK (UPF0700 family)